MKVFLVFKEKLGLCESWDGKRHVWLVKDQCSQRVVPYVSIARHLGCMSLWCLPMVPNRKYMSR
jgi:hypothetical protein